MRINYDDQFSWACTKRAPPKHLIIATVQTSERTYYPNRQRHINVKRNKICFIQKLQLYIRKFICFISHIFALKFSSKITIYERDKSVYYFSEFTKFFHPLSFYVVRYLQNIILFSISRRVLLHLKNTNYWTKQNSKYKHKILLYVKSN